MAAECVNHSATKAGQPPSSHGQLVKTSTRASQLVTRPTRHTVKSSHYLNIAGVRPGPGKMLLAAWKVLEIFVTKTVGTLIGGNTATVTTLGVIGLVELD